MLMNNSVIVGIINSSVIFIIYIIVIMKFTSIIGTPVISPVN